MPRTWPSKQKVLNLVVGFALAPVLFAALACGAMADEPVTSQDLPNGVSVVVAPRHTVAIAAIDIWVRAGTRRQTPGNQGVAHFLEHVLFKGTPTRPTESDIDGAIEDLGGSFDAGTSNDWAHFYTVVPAVSFEDALGVIADALQHATVSQTAVESERPVIESEIDRAQDDTATVSEQDAKALLFGPNHAYGQDITGTQAEVAAITRQQILDFYHTYYTPSNVAVVVAGDVTPDRAVKAVETSFGSWTGAPAPPEIALPDPPPLTQIKRQIVNVDTDQSYLSMAWPAPSVKDQPDVWTMDVLLTYLGQGGRNVLDDDLRRGRRLVTNIDADFLTQRDTGAITVTAALPTTNVDRVREAILKHVGDLQSQPLDAGELADAKQQLVASYLFDTETVSGRADALGFYEMIDTYQYDVDYIKHIDSVTSAQVQALARKYLTTDAYVETLIVPSPDPQNAALHSDGPAPNSPIYASARTSLSAPSNGVSAP